MSGLPVDLMRPSRGAPAHCALTSVDRLTVVNIPGPFEPTDDRPPVLLEAGPHGTWHIVPAEKVGDTWRKAPGQWAMGGGYAATSDGRFSRATGFYGAVAVHDYDMSKERGTYD